MGKEPPLTPAYVLELMRKQRVVMAQAQGFDNLNNLLVLEGHSPEYILKNYRQLTIEMAGVYQENLGKEWHLKNVGE